MNKEKCTLTDNELTEKCKDWIHELCMSKGEKWCLSIPVNFNRDPDILFSEIIKRLDQKDERNLELEEESVKYAEDVLEMMNRHEKQLKEANEVIDNIKRDIEICDWRCDKCLNDPRMLDADINYYITEYQAKYKGK